VTKVELQVLGGSALCTFKLHLAAIHLPDQVRACGASLEYWVERMVQVYKRMIKYRATAYPELIFINAYLLQRACLQILRCAAGAHIVSMAVAVKAAQENRRRRHRNTVARQVDDYLLGAPKHLSEAERYELLPTPSPSRPADLKGLPYLLYSDATLGEKGWPAYDMLPDGRIKMTMVLKAMGLSANGEPGDEGVELSMQKYVRAELPVGDTVSCVQCTTQSRKDNSWCSRCVLQSSTYTHVRLFIQLGAGHRMRCWEGQPSTSVSDWQFHQAAGQLSCLLGVGGW